MPFTSSNDYTTGRAQPVTPAAGGLVAVRFPLAMAVGDLAVSTIGHVGFLPAGCVPVEVRVDGTDMDSGAGAAVYQVGILDAAGTALSTAAADGGGVWGDTGVAAATAFDKSLTRTLNAMATVTKADADRRVGVRIATAPSTAVAGTLGVTLVYRSV